MNNPPAFPVPIPVEVLAELRRMGRQDVINSLASGMSLRDYFAAAALQGMLASSFLKGAGGVSTPETRAHNAYQYADAMLTQREKESA